MNQQHIIVFGGGVGGLTAAHELAERGFKVTVYEQRSLFGGKARSMPVPHTATPGHRDLPGEHGFRFVPGFYRHLPDTMRRIPFVTATGKKRSVVKNLVQATMFAYARDQQPDAEFPTRMPQTVAQLIKLLWLLETDKLGLSTGDLLLFGRKLLILLTSCEARRFGQWEQVAWWDFIEAAQRSPIYQSYLGRGLTRSLVAMKAEVSSTRTVGYILLQLILSILRPGEDLDRLLDGPTNDVWIDPWVAHLRSLGVEFHAETTLRALHMEGGHIRCASVEKAGRTFEVQASQYVAAVPVDIFREVVTPEVVAAAPSLANLKDLRTDWMNGVQLYMDRDVPEVHGHVIYIDSPWSLTSVSQRQFWKHIDLAQYANGDVKGIVSVDISDWDAPGILFKKAARACTREELHQEVMAQLKHNMKPHVRARFETARVLYWHLDPDVILAPPQQPRNLEPLLVNTTDSWKNRPEAWCEIPNLWLASDYVRTFTDLATMEGANEAARRAVNALLEAVGAKKKPCSVWPMREPLVFAPARLIDRVMWRLGWRNLFDWPAGSVAARAPMASPVSMHDHVAKRRRTRKKA